MTSLPTALFTSPTVITAPPHRPKRPPLSVSDEAQYLLAAVVPSDQLRVLSFSRVVSAFGRKALELAAESFDVVPSETVVVPERRGQIGLYAEGRWHLMRVGEVNDALDVELVRTNIVERLGIDESSDRRVSYVAGTTDVADVVRNTPDDGFVMTLCPPAVDDLMRIADAGATMPPKTTYFDPKFRSGIFVRRI